MRRWSMMLVAWLIAGATLGAATGVASAGAEVRPVAAKGNSAFATTKAYVEQFYPLWFTHSQASIGQVNQLFGPDRISPLYQAVVAINNDTLYASARIEVGDQPAILTVPETEAGYSILSLDPYGNVFDSGLPSKPSGTVTPEAVYGLTAPGWTGTLPAGVTPIEMPLEFTFLIFRIDRFSPAGVNQVQEATDFRATMRLQPLDAYLTDPSAGATNVVPERDFAIPFKSIADGLIKYAPLVFLRELQTAVHASTTPPLTPSQQALSDSFDAFFGSSDRATEASMQRGAQTAHRRILNNYLDHRGPNNWIHFTNIGNWGDNALDRASITEFIQYGNGMATSAYYHTFLDDKGKPLNGRRARGYVLTFQPGGQPPAERFWSLTAYTPQSIELIPNVADKYLVASYTPGLVTNADGSVSIHISRRRPAGVPEANWLPVSFRRFNLMLRVYGVQPGSSVADNTYVPPAVVRAD